VESCIDIASISPFTDTDTEFYADADSPTFVRPLSKPKRELPSIVACHLSE
jgi:hypothetical protein